MPQGYTERTFTLFGPEPKGIEKTERLLRRFKHHGWQTIGRLGGEMFFAVPKDLITVVYAICDNVENLNIRKVNATQGHPKNIWTVAHRDIDRLNTEEVFGRIRDVIREAMTGGEDHQHGQPWRAVDLDGTLSEFTEWNGGAIGKPIAAMVDRVKAWRAEGVEVRIFTARVACTGMTNGMGDCDDHRFVQAQRVAIEAWCELHIGEVLPITATKDFNMVDLWDDRAVSVEPNTGNVLTVGRMWEQFDREPDGWMGVGCGKHGFAAIAGEMLPIRSIDCPHCARIPSMPYWNAPKVDTQAAAQALYDSEHVPTFAELWPIVLAFMNANPSGGSLHIVLSDGNTEPNHLAFCVNYAKENDDTEGMILATLLSRVSTEVVEAIYARWCRE